MVEKILVLLTIATRTSRWKQPTKFEFMINLKAAKQNGLTIPPNVLARGIELFGES